MELGEGWTKGYKCWLFEAGTALYADGSRDPLHVRVKPGFADFESPHREQDAVELDISQDRYTAVLECFTHAKDDAAATIYFRAAQAIRHREPEFIRLNPELERDAMQKAWALGLEEHEMFAYNLHDEVAADYAALLTHEQREKVLWYYMSTVAWSLDEELYEEHPTLITWMKATYPKAAESIETFSPQIHEACKAFMEKPEAAKQYVRNLVDAKPQESLELPELD